MTILQWSRVAFGVFVVTLVLSVFASGVVSDIAFVASVVTAVVLVVLAVAMATGRRTYS